MRKGDGLPSILAEDADAAAVYGLLAPFVAGHVLDAAQAQTTAAEAAKAVWDIFRRNRKGGVLGRPRRPTPHHERDRRLPL